MIDTHGMSASAAVRRVERSTDRDQLFVTRDREEAHPDYPGGRKKVIAAIDAQLARLVPLPEEGAHRENAWHGMPHYECTRCPFDTLNLSAMREHAKTHELVFPQDSPELDAEAGEDATSAPAGDTDTNTTQQTEA